jgi:hypothetical protein
VVSSLINKIGGIYELVHGINNHDDYNKIKDNILNKRGDIRTDLLKRVRNENSHSTFTGTWDDLATVVEMVEDYLRVPFSCDRVTTTIASVRLEEIKKGEKGVRVLLTLSNNPSNEISIGQLDKVWMQDARNIIDGTKLEFCTINKKYDFVSVGDKNILLSKLRDSLSGRRQVIFDQRTIYDKDAETLNVFANDNRNVVVKIPLRPDDLIVNNLNDLKRIGRTALASEKVGDNLRCGCLYSLLGRVPGIQDDDQTETKA